MKPFRIGLCMAGAVSAGAYTAGVMDYLLEALEDWQRRRGQDGVPNHTVTIPVMGGASAGGMTAMLAASAIHSDIVAVEVPQKGRLLDEHPENKFYHSWVDLTHRDMFPKMLDNSDIDGKKIISLLNSKFIDEVADKMFAPSIPQRSMPAYFESPVKVFTTLSNLGGFHYNVDFVSGRKKEKYNMSVHNDYACFEISGSPVSVNTPGWIPLDFSKDNAALKTAKDAAMATGAFPVGLQSRIIEREARYVKDIPWLRDIFNNSPLTSATVRTLNVDGGMINNEPYEKVRDLLDDFTIKERQLKEVSLDKRRELLSKINSTYESFENTIMMIDPFPSKSPGEFKFDQALFPVIGKTLSAMTAQMRAKPLDYRVGMFMADAGKFIISPSRQIRDEDGKLVNELFGEKAIACGALGGFGGFIDKEFRIHDYFLGRHNCEVFLRDYFTVPADALELNPIFAAGYSGIDKTRFGSMATGDMRYQIIPIFTDRPVPGTFAMPVFSSGTDWPSLSEKDLERFSGPVKQRVEKIILNLSDFNWLTSGLLWIGSRAVLRRLIKNKVMEAIKASLSDWELLRR
ncbi:patatin-like phospholipase family protein [Flavobacterium selenitireducens]|uniref:patatin-like phospholipase family protein n=1 Tax=Flavobacterium selenitireducens TaxID=2722704 RepID=UPI00168A71D6|nr:patatin-like phospholipase family protein [Flavobacterium selenitireducens]MBD3581369.1 patatin-like phospholipase family protein [Flavobacterium selenitireducens]